ncbi:hypothetical protein V3C99_013915, partial [Haemonchus contortus]|uniref:Alpha-carbonic anhydrase domain-containing protein n=1 Tax=Haemonchus contortus TaxID=6289 RepID=A0A7I4YRD5_HAECO
QCQEPSQHYKWLEKLIIISDSSTRKPTCPNGF